MSKVRVIEAFKGRNEYLRFVILSDCPWRGYSNIRDSAGLDVDQVVRLMIFSEIKEGLGIDEY